MQKDMNVAVFTGRLTQDPELRATRTGIPVATLRVAIQRQPGKDNTDRGAAYYDVEVWNGLAETCTKYLAKGRRVAVQARLEHREWTPEDGHRRERNYVIAEEVKFLDAPSQNGDGDAAQPEAEPAAA